jgi:virginiamycin B lyase
MTAVWHPGRTQGESLAATDATPFIVEYAVAGAPKHIVVEAPGRSWFTMPDSDQIGRLVVDSNGTAVSRDYFSTGAGSKPYDLTLKGTSLWLTLSGTGQIARFDIVAETFETFAVPTANSEPAGIAVAASGLVWFVERAGNRLGRFDPKTNTFAEFEYPRANAKLEDLALDSAGNVWVVATGTNQATKFEVSTTRFLDPVPTGSNSQPVSIVIDSGNLPWVTMGGTSQVGRYAPGTLALWRFYNVAWPSGADPTLLTLSSDGSSYSVWFTLKNSSAVGYLTTELTGRLALGPFVTLLPTANAQPWGIATDGEGHVWIAESGANKIAVWKPPYFLRTYLPAIGR